MDQTIAADNIKRACIFRFLPVTYGLNFGSEIVMNRFAWFVRIRRSKCITLTRETKLAKSKMVTKQIA